jgi:predicted secreted protein
MAGLMKIVIFVMIASAFSRTVSIESENEVTIHNLETVTLEISSNPSTGYTWTAKNLNSDRFFIKDLEGTYIRGKDMPGAPGKQQFEVSCNEKCQEGDSIELQLSLKRSWEPQPIRTKEVTLRVVS